jgi:hypothetical protein
VAAAEILTTIFRSETRRLGLPPGIAGVPPAAAGTAAFPAAA